MERENPNLKEKEAANFSELAKKLLAVPKKEMDEQRAKYEQKKGRDKEKRSK